MHLQINIFDVVAHKSIKVVSVLVSVAVAVVVVSALWAFLLADIRMNEVFCMLSMINCE